MLRRVALVRTYVSEERSASFIRVTRIGELGTTLAVTSNRRTLRRNTKGDLRQLLSKTGYGRRHQMMATDYFVVWFSHYST
jgi:hypothetical protein